MKRGYFSGRNRVKKRKILIAAGVVDDGYSIREDELPPNARPKNWEEDYPQRRLAVGDLRLGDELVIADLLDLGPAPAVALKWIGRICERGASLVIAGGLNEAIHYSSTEDAALTASLAERLETLFRQRQGAILQKGREKSSARTGPKSRFKNDLKPYRDKIYAIWATNGVSRAEAGEQINKLLAKFELRGVSVETIQREFGNKTDAEKVC